MTIGVAPAPADQRTGPSRRGRVGAAALLLALGLLPAAVSRHGRMFFSPDETSYTEVTLEMTDGGDRLVPHLGGRPWLEKPPLAYWLLAGSFALFGFGLPAAMALNTVLTLLTAWLIAVHAGAGDRRAGLLAAAVYLTMFLPAVTAATALTDPALVLFTTAAIVAYLRGGRGSAALCGLFLGLGVMTKGPVAPLVVVPALLAAAFASRPAVAVRRLGVAVAVAAAVTIPWLAVLAHRGLLPQLLDEFLGKQVVSRVLDTWAIATPWWYYLPVLWVMAFPWGTHLALAPGGWHRDASRPWRRDPVFLAETAAVVAPLLVFSAAHNKLPHYLLPVLPWLACGVGRAFATRWSAAPGRDAKVLAVTAGALGGVVLAGTALLIGHGWMQPYLPTWTSAALVVGALALAAIAALEMAGRARAAAFGLVALGFALQIGLRAGLLPFVEHERVNAAVAAAVRRDLPLGGVPVAYQRWRTAFMADRALAWSQVNTVDDLRSLLAKLRGAGTPTLVACGADDEGDVRALAWEAGGEARERFRVLGLSERVFDLTEFVGLEVAAQRDGTRWFYDFGHPVAGEAGFSGVERDAALRSFRWTASRDASLPLVTPRVATGVLRLEAWATPAGGDPSRLAVAMAGCRFDPVDLGATAQEFAFALGPACLADPVTVVRLEASRLVRPSDVMPDSRDTRLLGAALDWIAIEPPVASTILAPPLPR